MGNSRSIVKSSASDRNPNAHVSAKNDYEQENAKKVVQSVHVRVKL